MLADFGQFSAHNADADDDMDDDPTRVEGIDAAATDAAHRKRRLGTIGIGYEPYPAPWPKVAKDLSIKLASERNSVLFNMKHCGRNESVDSMARWVPEGAPPLLGCRSLAVEGKAAW